LIERAETPSVMALSELADLSFDCCELGTGTRQSRAMLHPQPIQLAYVLSTQVFEEIPPHQLLAGRDENALLNLLAADGQSVCAGAAGSRAEAREAIAPIHHVPAAALSAFRQTGKQVLLASCLVESLRIAARCHSTHLGLACLHLVPKLVVYDSQLRDKGGHPIGWRIWSRDTLPGVRILDVS
jgi:hypothetical protein